MKKKTSIKNYFLLVFWSMFFIFFVAWFRQWYLLAGLLFIFDAFVTRFIPWSKIRGKITLPAHARILFEWTTAIFVALFITMAIRTIFIEAYKIPTPSMEKTLMVGDYLFVSKLAYGPKLPNTPLSIPFMPSLLPNGKISYSKKILLPYKRLKGLGKVKRNDVIVFNFPQGDTVVVEYFGQNYYSLLRQYGFKYLDENYRKVVHPVDKRDNYIKRCVAIPGDTLQIIKGRVQVNHEILPEFPSQQFKYYVRTYNRKLNDSVLLKAGIKNEEVHYNPNNSIHTLLLTNKFVDYIKGLEDVKSTQRYFEPLISFRNKEVFPHSSEFLWTADQFGPLLIPGRGITIEITPQNIPLYRRIIEVYENNELKISGDEIYINGKHSRFYTFKMNYYFVLGDNRHNSLDSRFWGFVPEDHLVGKAVAIWFSKDPEKDLIEGLRINRMFKTIK